MDGAGQPASDLLLVSGSPWGVSAPDVAWSGSQYLAVYHQAGRWQTSILAARVSALGEMVGDPILVRGPSWPGPGWPAVVAGPGGEFLGLWDENADGFIPNIYAQRVSAAGELVGPALLVGSALLPPDQDPAAVAYGDGLYLSAWEEVDPEVSPYPDYDLRGRFVDPGGALPGPILDLAMGPGNARCRP